MTIESQSGSDSQSRLNWPKLVIGALVSAALTVGAGYVTFRFTTREPRLVYELSEGPPLQALGVTKRIYVLQVRNTGRREVEDFVVGLELSQGRLDDLALSRTGGLRIEEARDTASFVARAAFFNPTDTLAVSFLSSSASVSRPSVTVRGRGLIGLEKAKQKEGSDVAIIASLLAGAFTGMMLFSGALVTVLKRRSGDRDPIEALLERKGEERNVALTYIVARAGLSQWAEKLRYGGRAIMYREVADDLFAYGVQTETQGRLAVACLASILLLPRMNSASRDVVIRHLKSLGADQQLLSTAAVPRGTSPSELRDRIDDLIATGAPARAT